MPFRGKAPDAYDSGLPLEEAAVPGIAAGDALRTGLDERIRRE